MSCGEFAGVVVVAVLLFCAVTGLACCKVSGDCSRIEEGEMNG